MAIASDNSLIAALRCAAAYPHEIEGSIEVLETHISWVFLAGEFAYKIKKPLQNSFVNYSTLVLRKHYCDEELRLNRRFSAEIYLDVVAVTASSGRIQINGPGEPIEYAVRMKRFPADALLSHRLAQGEVQREHVRVLARSLAEFHARAARAEPSSRFGHASLIYAEASDNCRDMLATDIARIQDSVQLLAHWTVHYYAAHRRQFEDRKQGGHIRECHGDLHLNNVVLWNGIFTPFDGIEFCEDFRWIDTLSDAAFTAMDFASHGRFDFCHSFLNDYLEASGDYDAVNVWLWYLVYRALVRAKVAALRLTQAPPSAPEHVAAEQELDTLLALAIRFSSQFSQSPQLWITYGLSGSGKTVGSEQVVQRHGAVRIRADVERKRLAGMQPLERVDDPDERSQTLYSAAMTNATYQRLAELAEQLINSGFSVIVDATFLSRWQRSLFKDLAQRLQIPYRILAFHADHAVLRQRILQRQSDRTDASDADLAVLHCQIESQQHLDADELQFVGSISD